MKKPKINPDPGSLRVLILEDNPADAELIERQLRRAKIAFICLIVEGKRAFSKALADFQPQVILSDFKLPRFDGLTALAIARLQAPDTPFIFVSGSIGEEMAIETLSLGAADYVFKDNLARLGPAVKRVIEEVRLKLAKKQTDEELHRHVDELRLLAEAADRFVHINNLDEIFDYLAQTIPVISGADYLLLSLYDEKLQAVRPKIIKGFEPFRETIRRRFQIDPMQMVFYLRDMRQDDFNDFISRRLLPVRDGLYGLANRKIPRSACRLIEKLLAIGSIHTMGFSWENQLYGSLTVLFKEGNELQNQSQVETLLNQATVSIKRLLAERSLRESEERFRRISATTSDISYSCISDAEGNYALSWMTGAADSITGYTIEEILAMKCWGKLLLPDDLDDFEKYVAGLKPGNTGICELRLRHKNGSVVWVQSSAECIATEEGLTLYGGLVNISGRKRIETSLRESEQKYRTLVTQSPDGIFITDQQGKFLSINQAMCTALHYTAAEFLSLKIWDIMPGQYTDLHKQRLAAILKGEAKNEAAEYLVKEKGGEIHYVDILSAPYYLDDKLIGFQGIARDVTEKKKMEILLRESEEYYRTLVETSPDAIILVDAGGRCTFASSRVQTVFGIPGQISIIGTSIMDFVDPEEIPRVRGRLVEILSGRSLPEIREYKLLRHDRQPFWGEISSAPLRDAEGRSIGLLLVCRDVSDRKRAEAALLESEAKYRLITDNTAETITVLDLDLKFTYISPSIFRLRGYTVEKALQQTLQQIMTPESFTKIQDVLAEEMALEASGRADPKRSRTLELQEYHKDGSVIWVENSLSFLRDQQGNPIGFLAVSKDINERKQAEDRIHYQADLLQNVSDAIIATDRDGRIQMWNRAAERIYGWKADEAIGRIFHDLIQPEYRFQRRDEVIEQLGRTGAWSGELIHILRDGRQIPVQSTITQLKDATGRPAGTVSVNHDISERKRAEEMLIERDRLLKNLTAQVPGMVYTFMRRTDGTYCIPYSSNAIQDIFGVSPQDVINDASAIFKPIIPEDQPRVIATIEQSARTLSPWQAEYRVQLPGEPVRWMLGQSEPFRLADGCILWYGFNTDITERKEAEEQIHASLKEKEVLLQEIHHRVKNNLQIISGLLTLQADQAAGKSIDEIFRESQNRIRTIALIHEKLYRSHNLAEIAFDDYLRNLVESLFISYGVDAGRITAAYDMKIISFTIEKAIPLGLIVNELVTNALKHAFPAGRRGEIRISLHGHPDAKTSKFKTDSGTLYVVPTCELTVADNGIGLPAGFNTAKQKTLGMNLVSMLANQLQAEIQVKTAPGSEFRLVFPAATDKSKAKDNPRPGGI
jgi:PAS domain S-box-containing protein